MAYNQTSKPVAGDVTAVIHTTMGDISVKFFPNEAPKAVENFITHAKNGYYNGIIFHRVIRDFMIQCGDPLGNGTGGQSIWGRPFDDEFTPDLHNIRGALSMANAGPGTNGSQFFIVQAKDCPPQMLSQMKQLTDRGFPEECIAAYEEMGGTPWLDFKHTVFGQVFDGMDIVDNIASVEVNGADKPVNEIKIIDIEVQE